MTVKIGRCVDWLVFGGKTEWLAAGIAIGIAVGWWLS